MLEYLKSWNGSVTINDTDFDNIGDASNFDFKSISNDVRILLHSKHKNANLSILACEKQYKITVKQYMTRKASPEFNFMAQYNNDVPMPLRTMIGTIEKETRGMYYMHLHGDITGKVMTHCLKCGRPITNPVSQYFGMGPECGGHNYVNPFDSKEELEQAVEQYRKDVLQKITWEGWVIKSAIIEQEEIEQ